MLRLELKNADSGQPGYGKLVLHGWTGNLEGVELNVTRNQDGRYLDASGGWSTNPTWHALDNLSHEADALSVEVGPWLIDPLVLNPQMAYQIVLRADDYKDKSVLRVIGNILSSQAAGSSIREDQRAKPAAPVVETPPEEIMEPEPEPVIEPEPVEPEPEPEVMAPLSPPPAKKRKLPIWVLLIVLLLIVSYIFSFLKEMQSEKQASPTVARGAPACSVDALNQTKDDLAFIQQCLKGDPTSTKVLEVIAAAKQARRCGVMQRLYAHKAQAGDAAIAFAYAQEYDPDTFSKGGCIASADKETAAYWYEIAVNNDPKNEKASQRLEALRK